MLFDLNEIFEGNGLKNFRSRATESFIDLKIYKQLHNISHFQYDLLNNFSHIIKTGL